MLSENLKKSYEQLLKDPEMLQPKIDTLAPLLEEFHQGHLFISQVVCSFVAAAVPVNVVASVRNGRFPLFEPMMMNGRDAEDDSSATLHRILHAV
jgi:hypothetical protein